MNVLQFPKPPLSLDQAATLANNNDVDTLYDAILEAGKSNVLVAHVLKHARHFDWNRELTVMMVTHALLMQSWELQGHVLELLQSAPPPMLVVTTPGRFEELKLQYAPEANQN